MDQAELDIGIRNIFTLMRIVDIAAKLKMMGNIYMTIVARAEKIVNPEGLRMLK